MENNFKIYSSILLTMSLLIFGACERVLEVEPEDSLPQETALTNKPGIDAAVIGAYSSLQSANYMGLRYWLFADMAARTATHTGTFPSFLQIYNATIIQNNVEVTNAWNVIYNSINRVNNIIEAVPEVEDEAFSQEERNSIIGEARFLRAYHYFNLMRYWGGTPEGYNLNGEGVPLVLEPTLDADQATPLSKAAEEEVWSQIDQDLEFASGNIAVSGQERASAAAAIALRARVELYKRNFEAAASFADQLIAGDGSDLVANFNDLFQVQNTSESIFELQFDPVNDNDIAFFFFPTANGGRNEVAPNGDGLPFEEGDLRAPVTIAESPAGTSRKYFRISTSDDHVILFRLGELYLTRAEALAELGNLQEAYDLVNVIRNRAGVEDLDPALTGDAQGLINAIYNERRLELALEGHEWFDLRRTNRIIAYLESLSAEPFRALWPIPEREINAHDGTLTQNGDY